ncbi:class II fructose-bisphosphatase [Paramaledivibacter caminithermalis]|jgi:fructose-1,6-bisphosphatase II|uniref:Fructose-1,6-bisphosphatase n=1 Tax=Paramaledivibacter caminithermalis (strain DSM 15212 / CIP 107654 / DViRD3) TaxID=1121301 RepID=A0A1M6L1Z4_PARC5|nr:class II fructose-bisphosphatase [Paramaledivibacter caminithermalis]SHJ65154.1 fructose-1,6-bisphosphatase II [Paramaledivibacter caminithermalis DSM 15212]
MDRNLAINLVRVTEAAALGCAKYMGRGDKNLADQGAVDSMRKMFDTMDIDGIVVIGEGELDEAPMLYIGERIGMCQNDSLKVDIAVDPLDGTNSVAKGLANAISVIAMAPRGCLLKAPDTYMYKLAVGPKAKGVIDLNASVKENMFNIAKALDKDITELTVTMLDRDRHNDIIKECRELGCRIQLFRDGDVAAAIATCFEHTGVDVLIGKGGAPEGVIAAAALKCLGGEMQGKLSPMSDEEIERCKKMGVQTDKVFLLDDLVKGDEVYFAATGVSDGDLLKGVKYLSHNKCLTHSVVMRSETGTIRFIEAIHNMEKKPKYAK